MLFNTVFMLICVISAFFLFFFFVKQKPAYDVRISGWISDVCSSDLRTGAAVAGIGGDFLPFEREQALQTVEVVTGEQPAPEQMAEASGPSRDSSYHSSELNAQLATLTPELRKRYGIPGEGEGVLVLDIKEGSVFEQGLRPGDVIRKVEGNAVEKIGRAHV